jgi:secreted trypsin-like serine protease
MRARPLLATAALLAAACSSAPDPDTTTNDSALIGGRTANASELPGIVYLQSGCTATKVAPKRILTAAHCALDPATTDPKWAPGAKLGWSRNPSAGFTPLTIAKVDVHPAWIKACEAAFCAASSAAVKLDAPDIAILELEDDIAVDVAAVSADTVSVGAPVVLVGYGCTKGVLVADDRPTPALARAEAHTIDASATVHDGSAVTRDDVARIAAIYSITPGPGASDASAGLCPGDSGGPLYAARASGELVVVGVNSNYTFAPDSQDQTGLPRTNWHTRLDAASRHGIAKWLASVGVPSTTAAAP